MSETFIEEVRRRLRDLEQRMLALEVDKGGHKSQMAQDFRPCPQVFPLMTPVPYRDGEIIMGVDPARPGCDHTVVLPPEALP